MHVPDFMVISRMCRDVSHKNHKSHLHGAATGSLRVFPMSLQRTDLVMSLLVMYISLNIPYVLNKAKGGIEFSGLFDLMEPFKSEAALFRATTKGLYISVVCCCDY